ncbi:MAG: AAA family ATPase [Acidobacteria bacterium]|nr:AAA family ATPase [Acidobacteriota bacterium]MCG2816393.1 AAA family ATPase [Candidatus Aminicenantes bacterium]
MKKANNFFELAPDQLTWTLDPEKIPFETSNQCGACEGIIGQDRALRAIQTGLDIKSLGYNIFITGMVGTGRSTTVKQLLENMEKGNDTPDDIIYVYNFKNTDEPTLITLPAGMGRLFKDAMTHLIEMLKTNIPELLKSKLYSERRDNIVEEQQKKQKEILNAFEEEAAKEGFSVIQVQMGPYVRPDLVPMLEGKPTPFNKLDSLAREGQFEKKKLENLKKIYEELTEKLEEIFKTLREAEEKTRQILKEWDLEAITPLIKGAIQEIRAGFPNKKISTYLSDVETHLTKNLHQFKGQKQEQNPQMPQMMAPEEDPFLHYQVNLLIDNSETKGAPVIMETNPNFLNLFGAIEASINRMGVLQTDFTKIKAGSLLKANGGYLVINALDALMEVGVWPMLKRSLKYRQLEIQNLFSMYLISTSRLKPEPIDLDVKVVLIGDSYIYNILYSQDVDFEKIFKIKAEFDSETKRGDDNIVEYATFIRKICDSDNLLPFNKNGMAAVIEYSTRMAGKQSKLSTRFNVLADVIREGSYWAKKGGKSKVDRIHVRQAIRERFTRFSLIEDKIQEMIEEGTIMIDTDGSKIGQVNGLSVYILGEIAFGKPTRITATTAVGRGGVINIERESDMSGRTHNKGVLILGGYLRGKYAQEKPFSLAASLAFEQSYSGVDGDSASSTEVYAILSSLSKQPLRQDIAVTGSLNQHGDIQPIGGVNEKVEGFFSVCKARGLTGRQGVIIPHQNVQNLMLNEDVVKAVEAGTFHIYPVKTIEEGITILTGVDAGEKRKDGTYPEGTINFLVDQELERLGKSWKTFASDKKDKDNNSVKDADKSPKKK